MNRERWQQVSQLYHDALAKRVEERATFLIAACQGDDALRKDVESLLGHEAVAEAFFASASHDLPTATLENSRPLPPGQRIGPYQILSPLGSGGTGDVYRAVDSKLGRHVAIKILTRGFSGDNDRLARLEREARVLAALNHPHICAIYGLEEFGGTHALALELVEGPTLAETVAKGPIPLAVALELARQIAEALEAAHGKGIIHRDLKPANIKLTPGGAAKVLDFGLATAAALDTAVTAPSESPTVTVGRTREGTILGTPSYMSPEQASGQPLDKRTDIWAFGCILYELLTGRRAFERGETLSETIVAVFSGEPDWNALPGETPAGVRSLLLRCLRKEPKQRLRDIGDARIELDQLNERSGDKLGRRRAASLQRLRRSGIAITLLGALGAAALFLLRPSMTDRRAPATPTHRQVTFSGRATSVDISPDGQFIAYTTSERPQPLLVQDLAGGQPMRVLEAEDISGFRWSPDGSKLLVFALRDSLPGIFIVSRLGGDLRQLPGGPFMGSWSPDGTRIASLRQPVARIDFTNVATGETETVPLKIPFVWLSEIDWSPRGDWLLISTRDEEQRTSIWAVRPDASSQTKILESEPGICMCNPRWSSEGDAIYYMRGGRLNDVWTVSISRSSGSRTGEPILVLPALSGNGAFAMSQNRRRLAYSRMDFQSNLWLAEPGEQSGGSRIRQLTSGTFINQTPSISPDGARIAFARGDGDRSNIFTMPIGGGEPTQITFFNSINTSPAWSPEGSRIAFASMEGGTPRVGIASATGGQARIVGKTRLSASSLSVTWSPSPKIAYQLTGNRMYQLLDPRTDEETPLLKNSAGWMFQPAFAPDGNQVALYRNQPPLGAGLWLISFRDPEAAREKQLTGLRRSGMMIGQSIRAVSQRGKQVRLRAMVKTEETGSQAGAQCWLRVEKSNQVPSFVDDMANRPVRARTWTQCEIIGTVDADAERIGFGAAFRGTGRMWLDGFELAFKDDNGAWQPIDVVNPGFERQDDQDKPLGWATPSPGYSYRLVPDSHEGRSSVMIENPALADGLFFPIGWSEDSSVIYGTDERSTKIAAIPAAGGEPRTVLSNWPHELRRGGASVTPDGRQFVLSLDDARTDVWIVDNVDR